MTDISFSDDVLEAFTRGDERTLNRLLGLKPWEVSPMDVSDGPCPWPGTCAGAASWPHAQRVRRALKMATVRQGINQERYTN